MKVYLLEIDSESYGYFDYRTDTKEDIGISSDYDSFKGESIIDRWTKPKFIKSELIPKKKRAKIKFGDVSGINDSPMFNNRAMECLREMIKDYGEFLPAETEVGDYYFYNCLKVVDVLDYDKTVFKYWDHAPDRIQNITNFIFKKEEVKDLIIFKIPSKFVGMYLFVTDLFKERVEECDLRGFIFKEIWDSEK